LETILSFIIKMGNKHIPTKEEMKKYCATMNCRDCPINTCKWGKESVFMSEDITPVFVSDVGMFIELHQKLVEQYVRTVRCLISVIAWLVNLAVAYTFKILPYGPFTALRSQLRGLRAFN